VRDVGQRDLGHHGGGELQGEHRVVGVRAHLADRLEGHRHDRAVFAGAHLAVVKRRLPRVVEPVPACVLELDRPAGLPGQQGGEEEKRLVAGVPPTELPADIVADGANVADRHPQHLADVHERLVGRVGIGPDGQAVVLPLGQAAPGIERALRRVMMAGVRLDDDVGLRKAKLHISSAHEHIRTADRVLGQHVRGPDLRVDHRRAGLHGLVRVQHERQHLPFDLDQPQGLLGDLLAFGGHGHAHLVAHPAGILAQHAPVAKLPPHHALVADRVHRVGPAGVRRFEPRYLRVGIGQDGPHARQPLGPACLQALDACARVRAAQHLGIEQAGEKPFRGHVVGIARPAARLLGRIDRGP